MNFSKKEFTMGKSAANTQVATINVRVDHVVKQMLNDLAVRRSMDLSKLVRAAFTNMVRPGTYNI